MTRAVERRTGERLLLAVVSRGARGEVDDATRDRALALAAMIEAAGRRAALPTAAGLLELLALAREAPPAWSEVQADWRALCEVASAAHDTEHWRRVVVTIAATGERELARLWGVELPGVGAVP